MVVRFYIILCFQFMIISCAGGEKTSRNDFQIDSVVDFLNNDTLSDQHKIDSTYDIAPIDVNTVDQSIDQRNDQIHDQKKTDQIVDQTIDKTISLDKLLVDTTYDQSLSSDQTLDQISVDAGIVANIGAPCPNGSGDCTGGASCILSFQGVAICTKICTKDNAATMSINEDDCPDLNQNKCVSVSLSDGSSENYCLKRCIPRSDSNTCPAGTSCDPFSGYAEQLGEAFCSQKACITNSECPVFTNKKCTVATGIGCSGQEYCVEVSNGSGECALAGFCNTISGICEGHSVGLSTAKVGDPCVANTDCGNNQLCLAEHSDGSWRGGYCTIAGCYFSSTLNSSQCPLGSTCNHAYSPIGGLCQKTCSLSDATSCRNRSGDFLGDYECYAWDNYTMSGVSVSDEPVCDTPIHCNSVNGCDGLGLSANSTSMSCRDLKNIVLSSPSDPTGYCLDNTASGPVQ